MTTQRTDGERIAEALEAGLRAALDALEGLGLVLRDGLSETARALGEIASAIDRLASAVERLEA